MPTEIERQGILQVFFENNLYKVDSDVSNQIECPGVTFQISKDTDQFTLSYCEKDTHAWKLVNDDQKDEFIGLLVKKLIFEVGETENAEYALHIFD